MDLGIKGRKAIVCASSRGLGRACALALAEAGCEVVVNGVDPARVEETARAIAAATGAKVTPVAADVGTEDGSALLLAACPDPDILVNNNSGPPPRDFRQLSREDMIKGLDANMMTPVLLTQKVIDGMVPGLKDLPAGCRFQNRCPYRIDRCALQPPLETVTAGHETACHRWRELPAR